MNVVTNTWRQLVRRRLWPAALLLVAALVAVPVVLATEPEPASAPELAPAVTANADAGMAEPVVAKVAAEDRTRRRRVLGARKDPFRPAPTPKPKAEKKPKKTAAPKIAAAPKTENKGGGSGGGSAPSYSYTPPLVADPKPVKKKKAYPADSVIVRFGDATAESLAKGVLEKLAPLPDDVEPLLIYMGLTKKGKRAKFLVDSTLTPAGDGVCRPHPSNCETVELAKGETEFFDVIDPDTGLTVAQYQLDLVAINR